MGYDDTYPDVVVLAERQYMDEHMDDWFVPEEDVEFLDELEYACWCDDRFFDEQQNSEL